jgi:hypothetical protein
LPIPRPGKWPTVLPSIQHRPGQKSYNAEIAGESTLLPIRPASFGEQLPYSIHDDLRLIWLGQVRPLFTQIAGSFSGSLRASSEDYIDAVSVFSNPTRQPKAVDRSRHFDIAQHDIDDQLFLPQDENGFVRVRRFDDPVAAIPEIFGNNQANEYLILDYQNGL